jgi:5-(carboxyamino)imidazole ribonucleotide synthase
VTPFALVHGAEDIQKVSELLGWPMVLKTTSGGYDGKGQRKVENAEQAIEAIGLLGPGPLIAEKWITHVAEVSVLVARSANGQVMAYPIFTNVHRNHILDVTTFPPDKAMQTTQRRAMEVAEGVAQSLQLEGLLCVEMFVDGDGEVMINELAPRTHNSGHLTIEACSVSQFEQQVRAVCNLPLGEVKQIRPSAMVNLLGDLWGVDGLDPRWKEALEQPDVHLHLYGKREARIGRKMGHLTVLGDTQEQAAKRALEIRDRLDRSK